MQYPSAMALGTTVANAIRSCIRYVRELIEDMQWYHLSGDYQADPSIMLATNDSGKTFVEFPDNEHNRQMWSELRYRELEGGQPASALTRKRARHQIEAFRQDQQKIFQASLGHQSSVLGDW